MERTLTRKEDEDASEQEEEGEGDLKEMQDTLGYEGDVSDSEEEAPVLAADEVVAVVAGMRRKSPGTPHVTPPSTNSSPTLDGPSVGEPVQAAQRRGQLFQFSDPKEDAWLAGRRREGPGAGAAQGEVEDVTEERDGPHQEKVVGEYSTATSREEDGPGLQQFGNSMEVVGDQWGGPRGEERAAVGSGVSASGSQEGDQLQGGGGEPQQ